jgi:REP element-mobilizing transposase RayT
MNDPRLHHRRSVRLPHHDYASGGAYFITVCSANKRHIFGEILQGEMQLNWVGKIVSQHWKKSESLRDEITLDTWQIMPNHFHAIVWIVGAHGNAPQTDNVNVGAQGDVPQNQNLSRNPRSLSSLIAGFKAGVTREVNQLRIAHGKSSVVVLQLSFYDRCIRDEKELDEIRRYIIENPIHWDRDEYA